MSSCDPLMSAPGHSTGFPSYFYVGSTDLNSEPHVCTSILLTEPSLVQKPSLSVHVALVTPSIIKISRSHLIDYTLHVLITSALVAAISDYCSYLKDIIFLVDALFFCIVNALFLFSKTLYNLMDIA